MFEPLCTNQGDLSGSDKRAQKNCFTLSVMHPKQGASLAMYTLCGMTRKSKHCQDETKSDSNEQSKP